MPQNKLTKPSEGYFAAKRQVQDSLDGRINVLNANLDNMRKEENWTKLALTLIEIEIIEKVRSQFRNTMLWDTELGP